MLQLFPIAFRQKGSPEQVRAGLSRILGEQHLELQAAAPDKSAFLQAVGQGLDAGHTPVFLLGPDFENWPPGDLSAAKLKDFYQKPLGHIVVVLVEEDGAVLPTPATTLRKALGELDFYPDFVLRAASFEADLKPLAAKLRSAASILNPSVLAGSAQAANTNIEQQAFDRIQNLVQGGGTELDLSGLHLAGFPLNFPLVAAKITTLNLANNRLLSLPTQLGLCANLQTLDLAGNELRTGYGLASLRDLRSLDLRGNQFYDFPNEVLELPMLERLDLSGNELARLPGGLRILRNLRFLNCSNCRLESLPPEIADMPALADLLLAGNPLKTPPLEIAARGVAAIRAYFDDLTKNEQRAEGKNFLLAVAVEHYTHTYDPRPGAVKEAQDLVGILREKYDYQEVKTLFDGAATLAAFRHALSELIQKTGPRDSVILYFNGWTGDARSESDFFFHNVPGMLGFEEVTGFLASMRAKQVLVIVDNHFQSGRLGQRRGLRSEGVAYASRWAMFRIGAEWERRFTPHLANWLKNNALEVNAQELAAVLSGAKATPIAISGDEGGEFLLYPTLPSPGATQPANTDLEKAQGENVDFSSFKSLLEMQIAAGETEVAIETLRTSLLKSESERLNQVALLESRFSRSKRDFNAGLTTYEEWQRTQNQVNYVLLDLLKNAREQDFDLSAFVFVPNTKTRIEAEAEALVEINQKIVEIEDLRKQLSKESSTLKTRVFHTQIEKLTHEVSDLRQKLGTKAPEKADETLVFFENLEWNTAIAANTTAAFEEYLAKFPKGLFVSEAQKRIEDLRQLEQETQLFDAIQSAPSLQTIQSYLSFFVEGRYRAEVEQIRADLEKTEDELWQTALSKNTVEAIQAYQRESKILKYSSAALERLAQLEKEGSATRVNEAKLIFVGNGRVGKTSLSKVLAGETFDPGENSTHGIRIRQWPVELPDGRRLLLNVWDFGGQEVYHNTHRFFLTTRALYLLVWDAASLRDAVEHPEADNPHEQNFTHEYWLQNVRTLSQGSPVVMVQNKIEQEKTELDNRSALKKDYFVQEFCDVSAATGKNLSTLRESLVAQFQSALKLRDLVGYDLPENWIAARHELEELAKKQPYIKYDSYLEICEKHDMKEASALDLAQFLHDVGQILYFPQNKSLREMVFLNPVWATEIVYRVLNEEVEKAGGRFAEAQLRDEWSDKIPQQFAGKFRFRNDQEVDIFLELMRTFEICFAVPSQLGHFVAPQFLPLEKPDFQFDTRRAFHFGWRYGAFLHKSVIARAIVRLSEFARAGDYWRDGILIENDGTRALVEADFSNKLIKVSLLGKDPAGLRKYVLEKTFAEVNRDMEAEPIYFCPDEKCGEPIAQSLVEKMRDAGEEKVFCPGCQQNVLISKILEKGQTKDDMTPKFFISYAQEDRPVKNEFVKWLDTLNWKDKISIWDDSQILPGAEWDKVIRANFASSEIIVLLVSVNFLASNYIKEVEFEQAMRRHDKGEAIIIPVIIDHCMWEITAISKLQCLPEDGSPLADAEKPAKAWKEVVLKIADLLRAKFGWGA